MSTYAYGSVVGATMFPPHPHSPAPGVKGTP